MRSLFLIFLLAISISSYAQAICGFDEVHNRKIQADPIYRKAVEENEKSVQRYISTNKSRLSARTTGENATLYTIPVVVHVIHTGDVVGSIYNPSDAQIQSAINYLNKVYNGTYPGTQGIGDIQLQFVLAAKDPNCNSTAGIDRVDASGISGYGNDGVSSDFGKTPGVNELLVKNLSRWNPYQYYNIWIVNKIDGKDGTSGTFVGGYAYFPGGQPSYDGTIILATQMVAGQKTLPHEIGHAFGLYHTFEGSTNRNICPVNTDCNVDGDGVCDTDPESYNQLDGVIDFSCRTGINNCTGTPYNNSTESNYMNYTTCYNLFTSGQKARMLASAAGLYRKSLTTSFTNNSVNPTTSNSSIPSCVPVTSHDGLTGGYAGILNIDLNNKSFGSSITMYDNGYVDGMSSCLNLIQLSKGRIYSFTATVAGINTEQLRAWIDFNNDGQFDNITEQIVFANSIPTNSPSISANFTVPENAVVGRVLRMRVIDDLSTAFGVASISGGCVNPRYGQAEDYPIYLSVNASLPVTLNSFTGELKNNAALLSWSTSMEDNFKNFEIEKSTDGRNFVKLATVDAAKKTASQNDYSYNDPNLSENNYYRLKMNDNSGASKLSQVVLIRYSSMKQRMWVVNNPFSNYIELGFNKGGAVVKLQLMNSLGAVVAEKTTGIQSGKMKWDIPSGLSLGNYIVRAVIDNETYSYKVIKE